MNKPILYEIIWQYYTPKFGTVTLKVCDYLQTSFPWLDRSDVVSINKSKLEATVTYLKLIAPDDYEFFVTEKEYSEF
jgi:hypothetical protein